MSGRPRLSRRSLLALFAALPAFAAARRALAGPGDQGIGGTGASLTPAEDENDRGIGGTGVIGTIRRFGSIYVNGMRISYPEDATVRIDGAAAAPASLRIGQVVRVIALDSGGALSTHAINVTSEAVGRVEKIGAKSLTVLSQSVSLANLPRAQRRFTIGDRVAVSGLRRPDGVIVASLVEKRDSGLEQIAGPIEIGADGAPMVGGLKLTNVDPALIGQRAILRGEFADGAFTVAQGQSESALLGGGVRTLSIEAYVERGADGLRVGSGLPISGGADAGLPLNRTVRAVLDATPSGGGAWRVDSVRLDGAGSPALPEGLQRPLRPGDGPEAPVPHVAPFGGPGGGPHGSFGAPGVPGGVPGGPAGGFGAPGGPAAPTGAGPGGFGPGGFGGPGGGVPGGPGLRR